MKKLFTFILLLAGIRVCCISQDSKLNIIVIGAHPDDCDVIAGGTAILYSKLGHNVKFVAGWFNPVNESEKSCLKKWYGEIKGNKVTYAETFRYTPYGRKLSEEETRKLFPMIK